MPEARLTLSDAVGPYDDTPTRLPQGYPRSDAPNGDNEYAAAAVIANTRLLATALADAGVDLFSFDQHTVTALASLDVATVRTVTGWVVRAHLAGLARAAAAATDASVTYSGAASPLVAGVTRAALDNKAAGANSVAITINARANTVAATWSTR